MLIAVELSARSFCVIEACNGKSKSFSFRSCPTIPDKVPRNHSFNDLATVFAFCLDLHAPYIQDLGDLRSRVKVSYMIVMALLEIFNKDVEVITEMFPQATHQ